MDRFNKQLKKENEENEPYVFYKKDEVSKKFFFYTIYQLIPYIININELSLQLVL